MVQCDPERILSSLFLKIELMFRKKLQNKNMSTVIINKVYKIEVIYKTFSLKNKLK